ncbi:hypothetical protein [Agarivorans sp. 1_MG-2023]|uniref:hypothetical protein n=1 Tax=Agarivorans sp. 1_MG-2023 TaxID=3062634 RepID=UPI0026E42D16|nr:hypothetical protein [Agarivorans sp. 1_MG-2023]MDO6764458.1 hypothetical protein [Agarivorans sp. 1_MG-2023]
MNRTRLGMVAGAPKGVTYQQGNSRLTSKVLSHYNKLTQSAINHAASKGIIGLQGEHHG